MKDLLVLLLGFLGHFYWFWRWLDSNPGCCRNTKIPQGSTGNKIITHVIVLQNVPEKCSVTNRVRRFRLLFSLLSETVFAHIFPVSNENENEQRNLGSAGFTLKKFSVLSVKVFAHIFPVSNKNERCTLSTNKTNQLFYWTTKKTCNALFNAHSPSMGP